MMSINDLLEEYQECEEARERAEEEAISCEIRMEEIKAELEELGHTIERY